MEDKIILKKDAPVKFETRKLTGWFSENHFYGNRDEDEDRARYDECTHYECKKCETVYEKSAYCKHCSKTNKEKIFNSYDEVEYKEGPFFIYDTDLFFNNRDEYLDYIECGFVENFNKLVLAEKENLIESSSISDFLENKIADANLEHLDGFKFSEETQKMIKTLEDTITKETGTVYYPTKLRFKL